MAIVNISTVINATESGTQIDTVIITDDEAVPTVTLSTGASSIAEAAGNTTVTATLSGVASTACKVYLTKTGTATNSSDYTLIDSITIPAGSTSANITLTAVQDANYEGNESVIITISSVTLGTISGGSQSKTVTITDDDAAPSVTLSTGATSIAEAAGSTTVAATLSAASGLTTKVYLTKTGTASNITDYTLTDSITIAAGSTSANITLTAVQDALYEGTNDSLIITISSITNGTISGGAQSKSVKITDDDAVPSLSMSWSHTSIGETANDTSRLTITQSAVSGLATTATVTNVGTGTYNTDYSLSTTSITIPAGSTSASLKLTVIPDVLYEGNEDPGVFLNATNATSTTSQYVTINDNDPAPSVTLSTGASSIAEASGTTSVTATLSAVSGLVTKVYLSKSGSATNNTDYTLTDSITIPAGSTSANITMTAVPDALYEGINDSVIVSISSVTNGTISGGSQSKSVKITDDDAVPTVSFAAGVTAIGEGNIITSITTNLSAVSGLQTKVYLNKSGTATNSTDYTLTDSITIAAGSSSASINLSSIQDVIYETNETVIIDISTVTNATENGTQQKTVTITDDESVPSVNLTTSTTQIAEAAGTAAITATQTPISAFVTKVYLSKSGTATNTTDFTLTDSILIAAGSSTGSITLTAVQDTANEGNETVIVDISSVTNGSENGTQQITDTIIDDDNVPTVTLSVSSTTVAEAAGTSTVTATLNKTWTSPVKVFLSKSGTGTNSTDYTLTDSITVPVGSTSASITLTAIQDALYEGDETTIIDISSVTNGIESGVQQQTVTITDDDAAPSVSIASSATSFSENGGTRTLTIALSAVSGRSHTIVLSNTAGSAVNGTDYAISSSSVTIPAGLTSTTVTLTAIQDAIYEGNETARTSISSIGNGGIFGTITSVTDTIIDDDAAPSVTLSKGATSIVEAAGTTTLIATLSSVSGLNTNVQIGFAGTATYTTDYSMGASAIFIPAGSTTASITMTAVQDAIYEGNESIIFSISSITNGTISGGTQTQTVTIIDDETIPSVTLTTGTSSISEATGTTTVTVTQSVASAFVTKVYLSKSGIATNSTDYTLTDSIIIPIGSTSANINITAVQDAVYETNETAIIDISSVTNGTESGTQQQTVTITDDESVPSVNLTTSTTQIAEAAGTATITATQTPISAFVTKVYLSKSGTATNSTDYTLTDSISIAAGSSTGSITLTAVQDTSNEGNETVIVDISSVTNGSENGTQQITDTIIDDDNVPTVTLSVSSTSVVEAAGTTTITATLNKPWTSPVKVFLSKSGTATNSTDYTLTDSITIPIGSISASITLTAVQDALYEGNETTIIDISSVTNGIESGVQQQTVMITDDDAAPTVNLSNSGTMAEAAGTTSITATLSAASGLSTLVSLSYSGTATNPIDYSFSPTIVIPAGSTSASITLTATQDAIYEGNETVIATISSVTNGSAGTTNSTTTSIIDDDASPTVNLSTNKTSFNEANDSVTITATLSAVSGLATIVNLTNSGTATLTSDYTRSGTSISIPAGSTSGTVKIYAVQDAIYETGETVVTSISSVTNGTNGTTSSVTDTIIDDEAIPSVLLSVGTASIAEATGTSTVTATQSLASAFETKVYLSKSGTATTMTDYTLIDSIIIPIGSTSASINITAIQDAIYETNEIVIIDISSVTNGTENGTQQQTITISDDDALPTVTLTTGLATIAENAGNTTVTATLSGISKFQTKVNLTKTGTAINNIDYILTDSILIPPGSSSESITITSINDVIIEGDETVVIDISSVSNATENGVQQKTVIITEALPIPTVTLSVSSATVTESNDISTVTATLSKAYSQPVTVTISKSGTAANGSDYTLSQFITIPPGNNAGVINLTSIQDSIIEANETVIIDIDSIVNGTENGLQQRTVTIMDDDALPEVSLSIDLATISENLGNSLVTATLNKNATTPVNVRLKITGSASNSNDYSLVNSIVIPVGKTSASINLDALQDGVFEGDETIVIDIDSVTNGSELGLQQKTVTISDDEFLPSVILTTGTSSILEAADRTIVTASLSHTSIFPTTINLTFSGTASFKSDYTIPTTITIPSGSLTSSIDLTSIQDSIDETDETIIIDISSVLNAVELGIQQKVVSILDDDIASAGIHNLQKGSFRIYPNPTKDFVHIELTSSKLENFEFKIHDIQGRLISSGTLNKEHTIDLKNIETGDYVLIILDQEKLIHTSKITKH